MDFALKILRKYLANEKAWLQSETLASMDPKYREGARMAKERIPELEQAIELLKKTTPPLLPKKKKTKPVNQISLWDILNP